MFIRPTNQGKDLSYEKDTAATPSGESTTNKSSPASSNGNHNTTTSIVGGIGLCLLLVASTASSVVDVLTPASLSSEAVVPPPPSSSAATVPPSPSVDAAFDTNANDFGSSSSSNNGNSNNENHKSHQQQRSSSSGSIPDRRYLAYATALAAESITDLDFDEDDLDDEDWGRACDDEKQNSNDNNDDDTSSSVCHANDTAAIARKIEEAMQQCPTKKRSNRPSGSNDLPTPPPADRNIGSGSLRIASALRTVVMRHILTAAAPKTPTDQQEKEQKLQSKSRRRAEAAAAAARAILTMPANALYALLQSIPIDPTAEARIAERFYVAPPRPVLVGRWSEDDDATTLASFYTASVRDDATDASACESSDEMMTFGNDARTATTAPPSPAASSSASTFGAVPNITATTASSSSDDGSSSSNTDRVSSSTKEKSRASSSLTDPRTEVVCCSATGAAVAASATETASCYAEDSCSSYEYGCYEVEPQHCHTSEPVGLSSHPPSRSMKLHRLAHDTSANGLAILRRIFECLPFNEVSVARTMAEGLAMAGELVMPRPLGTQSMTFVRWAPPPLPTVQLPACTSLKCQQQQQPGLHQPMPSAMFVAPSSANASFASSPFAAAQHQQQQPPMWRCTVCSTLSRAIQRCPHCATPLSRAACRVFIGQLRKDGTQGLVSHMLRTLCPLMSAASPLHIENHTNGNDGRGRGCAWVYLDCEADRQMVLEMHKRVFVDMEQQQRQREEGHSSCGSSAGSSGEEEGYWVLTDDALGDDFAALAQRRGSDPKRKLVLPKQLLVAEVPNAAASSRNGQRQVQRYAAEAAASEVVAVHPHHPSSSSYHSRPKEGSTNLMMKPSPAVPRLRQDDFHAAVASGAGYHSAPIECQRDEVVVVEESKHVSPDGAATTQVTYHHHHYHVHHFASSASSQQPQHPLEVPNGNYHQADPTLPAFYRHEPYATAPATSFTTKQNPAAAVPSSRAVNDQHQQHRFRHVPHDTNINHDDDAKMFPALPTGVSVASAFTAVAAAVVGGSSTAKSDTETKKAKQHRNSHNNVASFVAAPNRARRTTASAM